MESSSIVGAIFNPENDNDSLFLKYTQNGKKTSGSEIISSALSPNKDKILICFIDYQGLIFCLLYKCKNNLFNEIINLNIQCNSNEHNMGVKYIDKEQEYIIFCSFNFNMNLIKFDENIKIKDINENNEKCYTFINAVIDNQYTINSLEITYIQDERKYYLLKSYLNNNAEEFNILNIPQTCNTKSKIEDPNPNNNDESIDLNPISSTILFLPPSSTFLLEKITTTIPLTTTLDIRAESFSTTIENKSELSKMTILEIPSTHLKIKNYLPSTTLKLENPSTISESNNEMPSTIVDKNSTILEIKNSLPSTTLIAKNELSTETLEIIPKSFEIKNILSSTILEIKNNIFAITSLQIKNEISTTIVETNNKLPSTALDIPITIFDNKNEDFTKTSDIKSEIPNTIIEIKKELSSTILDIKKESSIFYSLSTNTSLPSSIFFQSIFSVSNNLIFEKNNYISFYVDGDLIKGKINKTKEEFEKNLDEFMDIIKIKKNMRLLE